MVNKRVGVVTSAGSNEERAARVAVKCEQCLGLITVYVKPPPACQTYQHLMPLNQTTHSLIELHYSYSGQFKVHHGNSSTE